jgi:hypothetical protein
MERRQGRRATAALVMSGRGVLLRADGWSGDGVGELLLPGRQAVARLDVALPTVAEEGEEEAGHRVHYLGRGSGGFSRSGCMGGAAGWSR